MSYTIERLPNEPIVVSTGHADFSGAEGSKLVEDMFACLETQPDGVYPFSHLPPVPPTLYPLIHAGRIFTPRLHLLIKCGVNG